MVKHRNSFAGLHRLLAIGFLVIVGCSVSHAQPLIPVIGIQAGGGLHTQQGEMDGPCGCATKITDANGSGFIGGAFIEFPLPEGFAFGVRAGLDLKQLNQTIGHAEGVVTTNGQNRIDTVDLRVDDVSKVKLSYISIAPYAQYEFFNSGPFVQLGPGISILVSNQSTQTRQINPNYNFENLKFANNGTTQQIIADSNIAGAKTLRLSALASVGWNIPLWGFTIAPIVTYDLPLTTISDQNASGWKVSSIYGSIALKFALN